MTIADAEKRHQAAIANLARARSQTENALLMAKYDKGQTLVSAAVGQLLAASTEVLLRWDDLETAKERSAKVAGDVVRALVGGGL